MPKKGNNTVMWVGAAAVAYLLWNERGSIKRDLKSAGAAAGVYDRTEDLERAKEYNREMGFGIGSSNPLPGFLTDPWNPLRTQDRVQAGMKASTGLKNDLTATDPLTGKVYDFSKGL